MKKSMAAWFLAGIVVLSLARISEGEELLSDILPAEVLTAQEASGQIPDIITVPDGEESQELLVEDGVSESEVTAEDEASESELTPAAEASETELLIESEAAEPESLLPRLKRGKLLFYAREVSEGMELIPKEGEKRAPITNMFETSWKDLTGIIKVEGIWDDESKAYILGYRTSDESLIWGYAFYPSQNTLQYELAVLSDPEITICDVVMEHKTPSKAKVIFDYSVSDYEYYTAAAEISNTDSYTGRSNITFKKIEASGLNYPDSDLQKDANYLLQDAMKKWNLTLQHKIRNDLTLNCLHFHSYGFSSPIPDHDYNDIRLERATFSEDGWIGRECTICHQQQADQIIYHPATVKLSQDKFPYNGKEQKPSVIMRTADNAVFPQEMYSVAFPEKSVEPGRYTVTITLKGNAEGTLQKTYRIDLDTPGLRSAQNEQNGIRITWDKVPYAKGYVIYRKAEGGVYIRLGEIKDGNYTTYLDKTVKDSSGITWTYTVGAKYGPYVSSYDNKGISVLRLATPLATHAFNVTAGINVRWSRVDGAASYRIFRKTKNTGYVKIASVVGEDTVNYKDTSVQEGEEYTYTVLAAKGKTISDYYRNGKMCVRLPLSRVYRLDNNAAGTGVKWADLGYVDGYKVLRKKGNDWEEIADVSGTTSYYVDNTTKTAFGQTFTYSVRGYISNSRKESNQAAYSTIGKTLYRLAPVTIQKAVNDKNGQVTLRFTNAAGATGCQVEYSLNKSFENAKVIEIKNPEKGICSVAGLSTNTTWYFRMRAVRKEEKAAYLGVYSSIHKIAVTK